MEYGEKQKKVKGNGREGIIKESETVISTSLPTDLNEVLQELPPDQRVIIESAFYAMEKSYTGPLPPPDYCESIEKIVPGATNRIITVFENQVNHRMSTEKTIIENQFKQSYDGQRIGAFLVVFFGIISLVLGLMGHDYLAGGIGITTVISLAIVFVLNKKPSYKNDLKDSEDEEEDNK